MKIAMLGYGKMGKTIETVILDEAANGGPQDEMALKITADNLGDLTLESLKGMDAAIDFSTPDTAVDNITLCFKAGVPVVVGTTGWLHRMDEVKKLCEELNGTLFYASNFSVGVNIFFQLNKFLAKMMAERPEYKVLMEEIHHTQKLDSPSGTAITLAQGLIDEIATKTDWVNETSDADDVVPIVSKRIEGVPGTHEVSYTSAIDTIEIKHTAHSRRGFAEGAVHAARWVVGRKGYFEMKDMLNFKL